MSDVLVQTASEQQVTVAEGDAFGSLCVAVRNTVAASSARIYDQTYRVWADYCQQHGLDPLDLRPANVMAFVTAQETTKTTRQRQLSALRKLAQMLYVLQPSDDTRRLLEGLKLVRAPRSEAGRERERVALAPREADKLLRVWEGEGRRDQRNRALVAVLLLGGLRRAEAAALRWVDVDFEHGVLYVRHGKGDRARDVPLAGDYALDALRAWQAAQGAGRVWVFSPLERGGHLGADRPIRGNDVYCVWLATAERAGIECKPHDARRTFITEALATGTPLATVQAVAGHAQGQTTLRYAQAVDARRARKELRLRYG